jgi:predicted nucleic acid-binding protein
MIVVADTSPLNYLIRLGVPEVLQEIYGRVLVPNAVIVEMQHPEAPPDVRVWASAPPVWLEKRQAQQIDRSLAPELGTGEREAISLAIEVNADFLLIDERAGREAAEARRLEVAGTLAILLQASLRGHVDFHEALRQLRTFGFRISHAVETDALTKYERAKLQKP